jgi:hypothetical protein
MSRRNLLTALGRGSGALLALPATGFDVVHACRMNLNDRVEADSRR